MPVQQVGFTSPGFDYGADISAIDRKRKLAEALQAQSMEPLQSQTAGGWVVPTSPVQGLAKLAQAWVAGKSHENADTAQRALSTKAQDDYRDMLTAGVSKLRGSPISEDASGNVTPAQAPDPMGAMAAFGSHPMGAQFMPLATQEMQRQRLVAAFRTPQPGQQGGGGVGLSPNGAAAIGAPWAAQAPQSQGPVSGGPAGGRPMEQWLEVDPSGKAYMEQLAKDYTEANKPVVNRGFGIGRMGPNGYIPDQASLDQALALERGKQGITAPMETPITLDLSGGQKAQLSRPEYAEFQKTGQLPARYSQQQPQGQQPQAPDGLPASVPPEHAGAYQTVLDATKRGVTATATAPATASPLGTPGLTQSQPDAIRQAREQAGGKAVDETFAKDYVQFKTGGAQDAQKQIAQLQDVSRALKDPKSELTGPIRGRLPDTVRSVTNPNAVAMRERVEEVVQRSLRAILGAQFTEKEGERLIARAYNPSQSQDENAIRVNRLLTQLQEGYKAKADAADYFEKNGTLSGWQGKLPTLSDFDPEKVGNAMKEIVDSGPSATKTVKWSDLK